MEVGTEILLNRIKDCPEEFADNARLGYGKWSSAIHAARECLPKEEVDAINKALDESYKRYLLDKFNENVLRTLAGENTDTADIRDAYYSNPMINSGGTGTTAIGITGGAFTTAVAASNSQMGVLSQQQYQHYADQQKAHAASQAQNNSTPPWRKLGNIF